MLPLTVDMMNGGDMDQLLENMAVGGVNEVKVECDLSEIS